MDYLAAFLESLQEAGIVFALSFIIYLLLSFYEGKVVRLLERKRRWAPFFGALTGVIPQCGIAVVGSDLFLSGHLTLGTLVAIFIACSDEALPVLLGAYAGPWYMAFALIPIKIVAGALIGYIVDAFDHRQLAAVEEHLKTCSENECKSAVGCCGHSLEGQKEDPWHEHLWHPLTHSLKIFAYTLIISFAFGVIVLWVGEANLQSFLLGNHFASPVYAVALGLIPNCVSSVLISELYVKGALPFGALVAGSVVNAGLGPIFLFRDGKHLKTAFLVEGILIASGLLVGYAFLWVR